MNISILQYSSDISHNREDFSNTIHLFYSQNSLSNQNMFGKIFTNRVSGSPDEITPLLPAVKPPRAAPVLQSRYIQPLDNIGHSLSDIQTNITKNQTNLEDLSKYISYKPYNSDREERLTLSVINEWQNRHNHIAAAKTAEPESLNDLKLAQLITLTNNLEQETKSVSTKEINLMDEKHIAKELNLRGFTDEDNRDVFEKYFPKPKRVFGSRS